MGWRVRWGRLLKGKINFVFCFVIFLNCQVFFARGLACFLSCLFLCFLFGKIVYRGGFGFLGFASLRGGR